MKLSSTPNKREAIWGAFYLIAEFLILPGLLSFINSLLPTPLNDAQLNFVFYAINFAAIVLIFRSFFWRSIARVAVYPGHFFWEVLLGLGRYLILNMLLGNVIYRLDPNYINANDAAISEMVQSELTIIAAGTILLVPPVEECLFRGLIFGTLYRKSPILAYILSTAAFSVIHIVGYVGVYTPMELLISFLAYLPAGICLGWTYVKADTIFAPILMHAAINAIGIYSMR